MALIPSVEFFRGVGHGVVPGPCIASHGPVESIRLLANEPLDQLSSVLVDQSSRSSVAMLRLLLDRVHRCNPDLHTFRPDPEQPLLGPDGERSPAALIIGDTAMEADPAQAERVIDMGEWWQNTFHRPFVYALWVYRESADGMPADELTELLRESFRVGIRELPLICEEVAEAKGWREAYVHEYLTRKIHFKLDTRALDGLRFFRRLCIESYLAPERHGVAETLETLAAESQSFTGTLS